MKICAVVPCMGRFHHIRRTAPLIILDGRLDYVLSDYECPDKTGRWIQNNYSTAYVVRSEAHKIGSRAIFKKVAALNAGAQKAIDIGAEYLCFLDADTLVNPGFHDWILDNADKDHFLITITDQKNVPKSAQTSGFICVHKDHFEKVGMFDDRMEGWGGEDMDLRIKLFMAGLKWKYIPLDLIDPITHGDSERTRFHTKQNKEISNAKNLNYVIERFKEWCGKYPIDVINTDIGKGFYELLGVDRSTCSKYVMY